MKELLFILSTIFFMGSANAQQEKLISPDGKIQVNINYDDLLELSILYDNEDLVEKINPSMLIDGGWVFGKEDTLVKKEVAQVQEYINAIIPVKSATIEDYYNSLKLIFKNFDFEVRVYNNGVAYRFVSKIQQPEIEIIDEGMNIVFSNNYICYFPEEEQLISHFENYYEKLKISEIEKNSIGNLPMLFTNSEGRSVSITESDVYDYPNLFLKKKADMSFESVLPRVVVKMKELKENLDRLEVVEKNAPYIAETRGSRSFPWRVFMISGNDKEIISNNLVYQLASPLKLKDISWIRPGKVAWDWWNSNNIYGVDFESGINTKTYKYYIDFASNFGLEYIILDEGWSKTTLNIMEPNDHIDIEELVKYGDKKDVGIILWSLWRPLDENMESVLNHFENWGVKGVKVDFIQRADQYAVNFYQRLAKNAAEHHLLVDFHGSFKPSGMRRAYPNIINYEGVKGLENNKWEDKITPEHNLTLPFTRMTAGVMDYTPGGMDNAHKKNFAIRYHRPMTLGTRAHQIAMYVVYEPHYRC